MFTFLFYLFEAQEEAYEYFVFVKLVVSRFQRTERHPNYH